MKICIYGGSFDPPTQSHYELAKELTNYVDQVWVMPCYKSIHGKNLSKFQHRMAMSSIAFNNIKNVFVSPFEGMVIQDDGPKGTQEILVYLRNCYVGYDIYYAIGQDNANSIHNWKNADQLLNENKFIVFPRSGVEEKATWYLKEPHKRISFTAQEGSSTSVRNAFKSGIENIANLNPAVEEYIRKQLTSKNSYL